VVGAGNRAAVLHGVKESHAGAGEPIVDQLDLVLGGDIKAVDASSPEGIEHVHAGVCLHSVERLGREAFPEPFRSRRHPIRAEAVNRNIGLLRTHDIIGGSIGVHDT